MSRPDPMALAREWVRDNAEVWDEMCLTAELRANMGLRNGMKALCEYVRFNRELHGKPYKLDNRITPALTRMMIAAMPHIADSFETRKCGWEVAA